MIGGHSSGVVIVDHERLLGDVETPVVGRSVDDPWLDAADGSLHHETDRVMLATKNLGDQCSILRIHT